MYNFIDVNEVSDGVVLPSEALKINGAYIEDQIAGYRTLTVQGREALSPDVISYTTGIRDGSRLKNKRFPERIITVQYQLIAESNEAFREAYNKLAAILNVENAELIFNDEQDKFFIGTPCIIGAVKPGTNSVVGEFEILCADPFKYSVLEYEATTDLSESSVLIDYGGTYKAYPTLRAEFYNENESSEDGETVKALTGAGDCGYVAFFTEDKKIIQIGDPDEAGGEELPKSQTLINNVFTSANAWGTAAKSQFSVNKGLLAYQGTMSQSGNVAMGAASYDITASSATTSGTLLNTTSKAEKPYIKYTITAKSSNRTANSVKVTLSITAALNDKDNYWRNAGVLIGSVYIGGAWHNVTLKAAADKWKSVTAHTKNITVTVTGLNGTTSSLTGIKFKAYRNDSLGDTGVLSETACSNFAIKPYVTSTPESYYLAPSSFGTGDYWHGPSITRVIPADESGDVGAANCTLQYKHKMWCPLSGGGKQYGAFQVNLVSGSGTNRKLLAGLVIYKLNPYNTALRLDFHVNDKSTKTVDKSMESIFGKSKMTYQEVESGLFADCKITKNGGTISFDIGGLKQTFTDNDIKDVAVTEVNFVFFSYKSVTPLNFNGISSVKFVKNNCDTWKDVPNKFSANDVVEADCKNASIYLNGVSMPSLGALGNDWEDFVLTPGLNQIGVSHSEWVDAEHAPTFKVRYREVFL